MSTWKTEEGVVMRIEDMTTTHIINAMALIERAMGSPEFRFKATLQVLSMRWMADAPEEVWDDIADAIEAGDYTQVIPWQELNREYERRQDQERAEWRARRDKEQQFT